LTQSQTKEDNRVIDSQNYLLLLKQTGNRKVSQFQLLQMNQRNKMKSGGVKRDERAEEEE
jgi:hypothetical protein